MLRFFDWLGAQAAMRPEQPAIVTPRVRLTFAELYRAAAFTAAQLHVLGVKPNDKVAVAALNPAIQFVFYFAARHLGAAICLLPPQNARAGIASTNVHFEWVFSDMEEYPDVSRCQIAIDLNSILQAGATANIPPAAPINPNDLSRVAMSSGTTADSKPIAVTNAQLIESAARLSFGDLSTSPGQRVLLFASLAVMFGTVGVGILWSGGTIYMGWPAQQALKLIETDRIHRIVGSAPLIAQQVGLLADNPTDCSSLVQIFSIGDSLPVPVSKAIVKKMCPNLTIGYGSSEIGVAAMGSIGLLGHDPERVGFLTNSMDGEAVDENDNPLPLGGEGHLRFRSGTKVSGYLNNPEATAAHFKHGWFYTGDMGRIMPGRLVMLTGRRSEFIKRGNIAINPRKIDNAVASFPGVIEAAAFSIPREDGDDQIGMALVAEPTFSISELKKFCAENLSDHAPEIILTVEKLPRNEGGKILRRQLGILASKSVF